MIQCSYEHAHLGKSGKQYDSASKPLKEENDHDPLTFEAAIPNTDKPIVLAGRESEAVFLKLKHYTTATQIEHLLNLRGTVLRVTIEEQ
jgi:hypothetical protein